MSLKVSSKGSVVIPSQIRKHYNIRAGSRVEIVEAENYIKLMPIPDDPIEAGCGMFKPTESVKETLKQARAAEKEREQRLASLGGKMNARK